MLTFCDGFWWLAFVTKLKENKKTCFTSSPVAENLFSIFESFLSKYLSITESLWSAGWSDLGYGSRPGDLSLAPVSE